MRAGSWCMVVARETGGPFVPAFLPDTTKSPSDGGACPQGASVLFGGRRMGEQRWTGFGIQLSLRVRVCGPGGLGDPKDGSPRQSFPHLRSVTPLFLGMSQTLL